MSAPSFSSFQPQPQTDREPKISKVPKQKRKGSSQTHREGTAASSTSRKTVQESKSPVSSGPWYTDIRGDPLNVQYGSLHSRTIPRYRHTGFGRVLGLRPELRKTTADHKLHISFSRFERSSGTSSRGYSNLVPAPRKRVWRDGTNGYDVGPQDEPLAEFTPIRKPSSLQDVAVDPSYRQLGPDERVSDSEESDLEGNQEFLLPTEQLRTRDLEAELRQDPSRVATWYDLIDHTLTISGGVTSTTRATLAVSILERALAATPQNRKSPSLWMAYLFWGEELWEVSKLDSEWESALELVVDEELWLEWLNWRLRASRQGVLEIITTDGPRCLSAMRSENFKLIALWWIVVTLHDAGYGEMGTALMQAQCELSLYKPPELEGKPFTEQLVSLEYFWENELPRLGERLAPGWKNARAPLRSTEHIFKKTTLDPFQSTHNSDPFTRWMLEERVSERRMPTRSYDKDDEDVYSTVLFADIKSLLIRLEQQESKKNLKRVWLSLLGLHIPGFYQHLRSKRQTHFSDFGLWSRTQIRRQSFLQRLYHLEHIELSHGTDTSATQTDLGPVKEWSNATLDPLEGVDIDGHYRIWETHDVEGVDVPTVRNLFEQLRDPADPAWEDLEIVFEAAIDLKRALRISRERVKVTQNSLSFWDVHAKLEMLNHNFARSTKVYENILSTHAPTSDHHILWAAYARMVWLTDSSDKVIALVCRSCGTGSQSIYSGLDILRAKSALDEILEKRCFCATDEVKAVVRLRFLLELVVAGPESLFSVYDSQLPAIRALEERLPDLEELVTTELFLLLQHYVIRLHQPFSRARLRQKIHEALERYPNNTLYLALFLECERGENMWGRVWNLITDDSAKGSQRLSSSVTSGRKLWSIWVVIQRLGSRNIASEAHRLRRLFSKWAQNTGLRGSSLFWRLWIEFELRVHAQDRAKALFVRAIAHCAPDKDLFLLPFGPLRSEFRTQELLKLMDLMIERGIRIRKEIDPYLVGWQGDGPETKSQSEETMDEVEMKAVEYRRLLPY